MDHRGTKQSGGVLKGQKRMSGTVKGFKRAAGMGHGRRRKRGFPGMPAPSRLPPKKNTGNKELDGPLGK